MARIRSVKPEFWADRKLAKRVSRDGRLLYIGLWNLADEHARLNGDPLWIKGQVFPYDDDIGVKEVVVLLEQLEGLERILRYEVGDDPYIYLPKLGFHQRLQPWKVDSRIPAPPGFTASSENGTHQSEPGSDQLKLSTDESEPGTDKSGPFYVAGSMEHVDAPPAQRRATRIPDDFLPTREMVAWALAECPHINSKRETEKFNDYWQAKAGKDALKLDWNKTWKNWMRNAEERAPQNRGSPRGREVPAGVSPRDEHRYRR